MRPWPLVALVACGEDLRAANVEACEAWLETTRCGDHDFGDEVDCSTYRQEAYIHCDARPYFQCLSEHTLCVDGEVDVSGWSECLDLAECER